MACMMLPPVATMLCALTCLLAVQPSTACAANLHALTDCIGASASLYRPYLLTSHSHSILTAGGIH